ncbi:MAG: S-formylglutathione hydrolase [Alphaproteobacteria bacterium]|nr:MAG: S-formylglutathione hydrolase [Alphaproteobacteria bacterium]
MEKLSEHGCFGGQVAYYKHNAETVGCEMRFTVFTPPGAGGKKLPFVTFLAGLTCTEDNFTLKAAAYKEAAQSGLVVIAPDTSPRGDHVPDDDAWDFAKGAGFYLDATQSPWDRNYRMASYIAQELNGLIVENFPADAARQGILGHSMGGHGALTLYLKNQDIYKSVSAFAPIVAPSQCPWGRKALSKYLGDDPAVWAEYDAVALMKKYGNAASRPTILIDQGRDDPYLEEQLKPHLFEEACVFVGQKLDLRRHAGYDHGYFFIQTFIEDHIRHHREIL